MLYVWGEITTKTGDKKSGLAAEGKSATVSTIKISGYRLAIVTIRVQEEFPEVERVGVLNKPGTCFFW